MALGLANGFVQSAGIEAQVWGSAQLQKKKGHRGCLPLPTGFPRVLEAGQSKEAYGTFRVISDAERDRKGVGTEFLVTED